MSAKFLYGAAASAAAARPTLSRSLGQVDPVNLLSGPVWFGVARPKLTV